METEPKHPKTARLFQGLLKALKMNPSELAREISTDDTPYSQQRVRNYVVGQVKASEEVLTAVLNRYKHIDAHFLLTGEGDPFPYGIHGEKRQALKPTDEPAPLSKDTEKQEAATAPTDEVPSLNTVERKRHTTMAVAKDVEDMSPAEQLAYYKLTAELYEEELNALKATQRHEKVVRLVRSAGGKPFSSASPDAADTYAPAEMQISHRSNEWQRFVPATPAAPERLTIRRWGQA